MVVSELENAWAADETIDPILAPYRQGIEEGLQSIKASGNDLSKVAYEYLAGGGKMIRPSIALLTCEAVSGEFSKALPIALMYELAHTASLTQDDIIDQSPTRHNKSTAHTRHGTTTAILISDVLLFEIYEQLGIYAETERSAKRVSRLALQLARAAKATAEGEYLEMLLTKRQDPTIADYVRLAGLKTGSLLAAASASGAIVGGAGARVSNHMYNFGLDFGIAFQVMDDILDMTGKVDQMGKPILKDFQNNAGNIAVIHALGHADANTKNRIRALMARSEFGFIDPLEVQGILDDLGSVEFASEFCAKYAGLAREELSVLPESSAKEKLESLTRWLQGRRK